MPITRYAKRVAARGTVYIAVDGGLMRITSSDDKLHAEEVLDGNSTHEETDTRIIQYILLARSLGYTHVRVHSPDSDVLLIQLLHAGLFDDIVVTCVRGAAGNRREVSIAERGLYTRADRCADRPARGERGRYDVCLVRASAQRRRSASFEEPGRHGRVLQVGPSLAAYGGRDGCHRIVRL